MKAKVEAMVDAMVKASVVEATVVKATVVKATDTAAACQGRARHLMGCLRGTCAR